MLKKITTKEWLSLSKHIAMELPMDLLSFIIVPIALIKLKPEDDHLPKWARYFDEERYGINAELKDQNGILHSDEGHCGKEGRFPRPKNRTYYARLRWLLRNRIGVFTTEVTGIKFSDIDPTTITLEGDRNTPSYSGRKGTKWGKVTAKTKDGKHIWSYFGNVVWSDKFYIRLFLGHKIFDVADIALEKTPEAKIEAMKKFLENPDSKIYAKSVWAFHPFRIVKKG